MLKVLVMLTVVDYMYSINSIYCGAMTNVYSSTNDKQGRALKTMVLVLRPKIVVLKSLVVVSYSWSWQYVAILVWYIPFLF